MVEQLRESASLRSDYKVIMGLINPESSMLDLGCGDGSLLRLMELEKNVSGIGVEYCQDMVMECVRNGASVIHKNLNDGLDEFCDGSYDYVVLSHTLQAVERPDLIMQEMLRVGDKGIISFINMGYLNARLQLMFGGKMPVTKTLPSQWYDTTNIHLATITDFKNLCNQLGITILKQYPLRNNLPGLAKILPNVFASTCVFLVSKMK